MRLDKRAGWTGVETERAGAALVERGLVGLERQAAHDFGEQDPGAEVRVDDARVLADPAEAGILRVDALLHRPGVDIRSRVERLRVLLAHPREERVEPPADDVVVVVGLRVPRDL